MEDRLVVSIAKNCLITSTLIVVFSTSLNSAAETQNNDQNQVSINSESITKTSVIRFYKANKHQQNFRIYPSKSKTSESGCHNFKRSRRIAKVVQIGYQSIKMLMHSNLLRAMAGFQSLSLKKIREALNYALGPANKALKNLFY